jgi:hypothetical protein
MRRFIAIIWALASLFMLFVTVIAIIMFVDIGIEPLSVIVLLGFYGVTTLCIVQTVQTTRAAAGNPSSPNVETTTQAGHPSTPGMETPRPPQTSREVGLSKSPIV